jgi:hypothetical protein
MKMRDDLNFFEKGRRPQFFENGKLTQKDNAIKNNNIFENGRQPQVF